MFEHPNKARSRNFEKQCRVKEFETSTSLEAIDSMLLGRIPSSSGVNDETIEANRPVSSLLK